MKPCPVRNDRIAGTILLSFTMSDFLTRIDGEYELHKKNYWLRYGKPVRTEILFRTQEKAKQEFFFEPDSLFCFDLWECNKYGTTKWRVIVGRTLKPGESGEIVPNVTPAVKVLMDVKGAFRSKAVLKWLKELSDKQDILLVPDAKFELGNLRFNTLTAKELQKQKMAS